MFHIKCARLANICYLFASELITCVCYMPHGIQFSFCIQGGGWIRRIWGPVHCFNPKGIGNQTDTDTTQITIGSENLLSFSIFRDGSAEYFVMLLQEDPIAKVRKRFCESFTFFFLTGCSFQKASLSIKCHFLSCPNDNSSIQSLATIFLTFLEFRRKHLKIVNVK